MMFIAGCHRSGTSLLACLMKNIVGQATAGGSLLPPAIDNPQGFYESEIFNALNEHLLKLAGYAWDEPPLFKIDWSASKYINHLFLARNDFASMALESQWVEKDPRLCITAPAMEHLLLRRVPIMAILRDPSEVAISLFRRNGIAYTKGLTIWFLYNFHLASILHSNDALVIYEQLINNKYKSDNSGGLLDTISAFLQTNQLEASSGTAIDELNSSLINPKLNRSSYHSISDEEEACQQNSLHHHCESIYQAITQSPNKLSDFHQAFNTVPRLVLDIMAPLGFWQWRGDAQQFTS